MSAIARLSGFGVRLAPALGGHPILSDISLTLAPGARLALVGESGSGKSTLGLALAGLLPTGVMIGEGKCEVLSQDMSGAPSRAWASLRGHRIGMVFQDPSLALNPVLRISEQVHEAFHGTATREQAAAHLGTMGFRDPQAVMQLYPHQMSGGMKQRAIIAMATAMRPQLIIADEPTTALDPSLRRDIMDLLVARCEQDDAALLLITHDLVEARHAARDIAVMYAGCIVEQGRADAVLRNPRHRYTEMLIRSRPGKGARAGSLPVIPGRPPRPGEDMPACAFAPRCAQALEICKTVAPPQIRTGTQRAYCHAPSKVMTV